MKRLFQVNIEVTIAVIAKDEYDAELVAKRYVLDEVENAEIAAWPMATCPTEWEHCYPYGDDDEDRTCGQIMMSAAS